MREPGALSTDVRYTALSDRFRSLWTFYQFLAGVLKHLDEGPVPYDYDFQGLHRRIQGLVHTVGIRDDGRASAELDKIERELGRIHRELSRIESDFAPSLLRRFFDHIKRQDEKVLCALIKFYLMSKRFEQDTLDKLDILVTRLAETPGGDGPITAKDSVDLRANFEKLGEFAAMTDLPPAELTPLVEAVLSIRSELEEIDEYQALVDSKVFDRYRRLKQRLGKTALQPEILVEITTTNIIAKNRFKKLFEAEEKKVVEKTNRIYEIERYLTHHPELANDELQRQLEDFRHFRIRYESGRRKENVKRQDISEMTRAMQAVLAQFDPHSGAGAAGGERDEDAEPQPVPPTAPPEASVSPPPPWADEIEENVHPDHASISGLLPPDPVLDETLHRIMFSLEMVVWDKLPAQVAQSPEARNLGLEEWEVESYRRLAGGAVERATAEWELYRFFLTAAALRVKMEEETEEILRIGTSGRTERLVELLERSAQSLERARDVDHRFQWFIDDMLFRGDTHKLDQVYRSRFRFLNVYSGLWLDHQQHGGLTPL